MPSRGTLAIVGRQRDAGSGRLDGPDACTKLPIGASSGESQRADASESRDESLAESPGEWQHQLRQAVSDVETLATKLTLSPEEREGALRAEKAGLPLRITPYYLGLCHQSDPACPIRLQVVPRLAEQNRVPGDLHDPLGEQTHQVAPYLIQRYPDRALLIATDQCAVYCRFCTRSRVVGGGHGPAPWSQLQPAFDYLRAHPEVRDVILSGGDPLAMTTGKLVRLIKALRSIDSIEVIRLATRVPVCLPQRIQRELIDALRPHHPLWLMTHFNHPNELTPEAARACQLLADGGFPVMNQTVLLRGVNDDAATLERLFRGLVRWRVRPYYLMQMDPVSGSSHLRTPLSRGVELMDRLQGRLSGIALPKLIVDTPGGLGKVPIGPDYVLARAPGRTTLRTHRGAVVDYLDPPV